MIYYCQVAKSGSLKQTNWKSPIPASIAWQLAKKWKANTAAPSVSTATDGCFWVPGNLMLLVSYNCLLAGDSKVALKNRGNQGGDWYLPQGIWKCGKDYASIGEKSLIKWFFPQDWWHYYTNNWQGFADAVATSVMLEACRINAVIHTCLCDNLPGQISVSELAACG